MSVQEPSTESNAFRSLGPQGNVSKTTKDNKGQKKKNTFCFQFEF